MQYRNYSERTIETYSKSLAQVSKSLQKPLDKITGEDLKKYLHQRMVEESISTSCVNQFISAYKLLQTDVLKLEWETMRIKRPRREKKLPTVLSQQEVAKLISCTTNIKHRALLMLAYSAGLRREELQKIKSSAIDSQRMMVHVVQGKGKKDRYTILSDKALEMLRVYYKMFRPKTYLFESQVGKGCFLSSTTLTEIVKNSAQKAGIKKTVSFHTLRHCFATHLLEQGVNLKIIQQYLGHNSLQTTSIYLHLANISPSSISSPLDFMDI
jgi:site-specific recombinase XerD